MSIICVHCIYVCLHVIVRVYLYNDDMCSSMLYIIIILLYHCILLCCSANGFVCLVCCVFN